MRGEKMEEGERKKELRLGRGREGGGRKKR